MIDENRNELPTNLRILSLYELHKIESDVDFLCFSQDDSLIAASTSEGPIRLWNVLQRKQIQQFPLRKHREVVSSLSFLKNTLQATSYIPLTGYITKENIRVPLNIDGIVKVHRYDGSPNILLPDHQPAPTSASCSPKDDLVITTDFEWNIRLYNSKNGTLYSTHLWQGGRKKGLLESRIDLLAFSKDGNYIALCCDSDRAILQIWLLNDSKDDISYSSQLDNLSSISLIAFSTKEDLLGIITDRSVIKLYSLPELTMMESISLPPNRKWGGGILDFAISPDNRYIALADEDAKVWIWDIKSHKYTGSFQAHPNVWDTVGQEVPFWSLKKISWSIDGKVLSSCGYYPTKKGFAQFSIRLWKIEEA